MAVGAQKLPSGDPKSDMCPGSGDTESDYHRHHPTGLLALVRPFEFIDLFFFKIRANAAFLTSSALLLGTRFLMLSAVSVLAANPLYAKFDAFGD